MRLALFLIISGVLAACSEPVAQAPEFPFFSEEGGRVRDMAGILSVEAEQSLAARIVQTEQAYGPQIALVTVDSLEGYAVEDFSIEYARAWGLGDKDRNDGIMMMVAPDDSRVRIEIGSGIEDSFTDIYCAEVIAEKIIPAFTTGDYEAGIVAGMEELMDRAQKFPTKAPANDNTPIALSPVQITPDRIIKAKEAA